MQNDYDSSRDYQREEEPQGCIELELLPVVLVKLLLQLFQAEPLEARLGLGEVRFILGRPRVLVQVRIVDGHDWNVIIAAGVVDG